MNLEVLSKKSRNMEDYPMHPIFLSFLDNELEKVFTKKNDVSHLNFYRTSLILASLGDIGLIVTSYFHIPLLFKDVLLIISIFIFPYFILLFWMTYRKPLSSNYQIYIGIGHIISSLTYVYIFAYLYENYLILSGTITLAILFAHFLTKLRFKIAVPVTLFYSMISLLIMLIEANYTLIDITGCVFGYWFGLVSIGFAGYYHEKTVRTTFVQRLLLEDQRMEIIKEREKSEELLLNILPKKIAFTLKNNTSVIAERHENVTVLFADIANFTSISSTMKPKEVVSLLNDLFVKYDRLSEKYELEKIKTIGDAYMVAAGIPEACENHVEKMLDFSLEMIEATKNYNENCNWDLNIRIGINSGPAIAGIIGEKKFQYDIWGDTVNTASRMESYGVNGKIQVSEDTYRLANRKFNFELPITLDVKGKGQLSTYFLIERIDSIKDSIS